MRAAGAGPVPAARCHRSPPGIRPCDRCRSFPWSDRERCSNPRLDCAPPEPAERAAVWRPQVPEPEVAVMPVEEAWHNCSCRSKERRIRASLESRTRYPSRETDPQNEQFDLRAVGKSAQVGNQASLRNIEPAIRRASDRGAKRLDCAMIELMTPLILSDFPRLAASIA